MSRRRSKPRFTRSQQGVIAFLGVVVIAGGVGALLAGNLFFHTTPGSPFGWVFAPFALIVGVVVIAFAISLGREH